MPDKKQTLYPLRLMAMPVDKVWGGQKLARTFRTDLPVDRPIGEVWVVWRDLAVENGPFRGRTLAALARDLSEQLLGRRPAQGPGQQFPLLVKLIDAQQTLSVQVHPDGAYAQRHEGEPFGKAEAWYILDADPGAQLIHGVERRLSRLDAERAIVAGTLQEKLAYVDVAAGDVVFNPPGTIHALGAGLLLYEVQQSSDLTYRLYDWNRQDPNRPLHIEKSLDVADLEPYAQHKIDPVEVQENGGSRTYLCACRYFAAELLTVRAHLAERPAGASFHILTALQGSGTVRFGAGSTAAETLNCGESLLIPAGIEDYQIEVTGHPLVAIKAYVPDLLQDIVNPLRKLGIPDPQIAQLGGMARHSDLLPLTKAGSRG